MRTLTGVIGALDAALWLLVVGVTIGSTSDAATRGMDHAAGIATSALFAVTALPALLLTWRNRARRVALALALAFPVTFAVLFAAAVAAFAR